MTRRGATWSSVAGMIAALICHGMAGHAALATQSKSSIAYSTISVLRTSLERFRSEYGRYPTQEEGLRVLFQVPSVGSTQASSRATGLDPAQFRLDANGTPLDSWGHPYRYWVRPDDVNRPYEIYSCGRDGVSHSNGNDPGDINSWAQLIAEPDDPTIPGFVLAGLGAGVVLCVALVCRRVLWVARQTRSSMSEAEPLVTDRAARD